MKVILGGTVINPNSSVPIENSFIVVKGGRIELVGKRSDGLEIPRGAQVIHAEGKWIIPGLIDAHIHFFQSGGLYTRPDVIDLREVKPYEGELAWIKDHLEDTFARYIRSGVTSVVDVGGPVWNFEVREMARKRALAPRVAVAGPLISTYQPRELVTEAPPIIKVNSPDEARSLVRYEAAWKPDLMKIWFIVPPGDTPEDHMDVVEAAIDESHELGIRVVVHATELETARSAVKAGADILAHSVDDRLVDDEFLELLKHREVVYTTTLMVSERYDQVLSQQVALTPPELEIANPYVLSTLFDLQKLPSEAIPPSVLLRMKARDPVVPSPVALRNLKRVKEAGITVALGTDAGNIGTPHGPAIFREMELMQQAGLSAAEILEAATVGAAKVMGREKEVGAIEKGMLADMVILNSNPLADIKNTSRIHLVMKDGRIFMGDGILEN